MLNFGSNVESPFVGEHRISHDDLSDMSEQQVEEVTAAFGRELVFVAEDVQAVIDNTVQVLLRAKKLGLEINTETLSSVLSGGAPVTQDPEKLDSVAK